MAEETTITKDNYAERLAAVNAKITFTNIRGKEYAEVNQRVLAFWSLFPDGCIVTKKLFDNEGRCDFEAAVYRHEGGSRPAATGHAYEVKQGNVNSTSYVENCETSAIGRALGFLGIGATGAIASADEVLAAIARQEAQRPDQPDARSGMVSLAADLKRQAVANGVSEEGINSWYAAYIGDAPLNRLGDGQLQQVIDYLSGMVRDTADGHLLARPGQGA